MAGHDRPKSPVTIGRNRRSRRAEIPRKCHEQKCQDTGIDRNAGTSRSGRAQDESLPQVSDPHSASILLSHKSSARISGLIRPAGRIKQGRNNTRRLSCAGLPSAAKSARIVVQPDASNWPSVICALNAGHEHGAADLFPSRWRYIRKS